MAHKRVGKIKRHFRYLNVFPTREVSLVYIHPAQARCINRTRGQRIEKFISKTGIVMKGTTRACICNLQS
jgi:hypothetical protein